MDVSKLNKEELDKIEKQIKERKEEIKNEELNKRREKAKIKLDKLREYRDFLMEIIEHGRTSCSDTNVCNGWGSADYGARCSKCHLIELLDNEWGNEFEVDIEVAIAKIG
jgi:hypothetical protein